MTENKTDKSVNNPLEYGMMTLEEFVNLKAKPYKETSFINSQKIQYDKGLKIDGHLSRLMQVNDYIARVDINIPNDKDDNPAKLRYITVRPKIAGIVTNPYAITLHHNNRTNNKRYDINYEAEIKRSDSNEKTFSRTVERAGIPHITFHELRHTTASRLNEKGVDILTIKEILDHSDLKTTQQYTHTPRKNILDAVNILEEY